MNRKSLLACCFAAALLAGCTHTVYTERCEPDPGPVVVRRTVVVDAHRRHYHRHRPYAPRQVVVVRPRPRYVEPRVYVRPAPHHREWARREEPMAERRAQVRARADVRTGDVRLHAEASAR